MDLSRVAITHGSHTRLNLPAVGACLEDRLDLSYGTIRKRLRTNEARRPLPEAEQVKVRLAIPEIGATKAAILAPAIQDNPARLDDWLAKGKAEPIPRLQELV